MITPLPARLVATALAAALAGTTAACGGEDTLAAPPKQEVLSAPAPLRPGTDIARITRRTMKQSDSFRVRGTVSYRGRFLQTSMRITQNGECAAEFSERHGLSGKAVVLEDAVYLNGGRDFWEAADEGDEIPDGVIEQMAGRWIEFPPDDSFGDLCPWSSLQRTLFKVLSSKDITVGPSTLYAGKPVIELVDGSEGSVTVEARRPHRIVAMSGSTETIPNGGGRRVLAEAKFSAYDSATPIKPPPGAVSVYDLSF